MDTQLRRVAADDSLTAIYRMSHDERLPVIAARLVERLGVSAPSMAAMLRRLERDGLIMLEGPRQIALTPYGLERAERMIRRHRLAECFLIEVLRIDWWRAYDEAHLLEHSISDVTEPLFEKLLNRPVVSPFGYPIPRGSESPEMSFLTVEEMQVGEVATIQRVFEEDTELLRYFDQQGIRPGAAIELCDRAPVLGTVTVQVDGHESVFATTVSQRIWIERSADSTAESGRARRPAGVTRRASGRSSGG